MKKSSQLIWLDPITLANATRLFVQSGASEMMAINEFISKILSTILNDDELVKKVVQELYSKIPELKTYSDLVIKEEKVIEKKVYVCHKCFKNFSTIDEFYEHYSQAHGGVSDKNELKANWLSSS
jgi:hypothetical protein